MLVGRQAQLARIRGLVDGVVLGRGGVTLVVGEAGVGKTRLLDEAATRARERGLPVFTGHAMEGNGSYRAIAEAVVPHLRAYGPDPWAELRPYRGALGRLLPGWAEHGSIGQHQPEPSVDPAVLLGEGLLRLLRLVSPEAGSLLLLEDLHWADADTLAVVEYLARAALDWPALILASARDDEPSATGSLHRLRERGEVTTLRLGRLSNAEVAALATQCAGGAPLPEAAVELVVNRADGLPLLVEELVAGLADGVVVPPTYAGLVADRLAALTPPQRRVLEAAAVLGDDPDWAVVGAITGLADGVVLEALRAARTRLLVPAGDGVRWRHALTRDAVAATMLPPERSALARRAATVLLGRGGRHDEFQAAALLAAAGDRAAATEVFLRLARRELAAGALHGAGELLERAAAGGAPAVPVAIEQVRLLTLRGRAAAALETGERVIDSAVGEEHSELCLELADAAVAAGRWRDVTGFVQRAGRPADPRAICLAAEAAFGTGDPARAAELAGRAARLAEPAGHWEPLCRALNILARCDMRHEPARAELVLRRAAQLAAEHGLIRWRVAALVGLGLVELFDRATSPTLLDARELATDNGQLAHAGWITVLLADGAFVVDGPRAGRSLAQDAARQGATLGLGALRAIAELYLAAAHAAEGDERAMQTAVAAATAHPDAPVEVGALVPAVQALCRLVAGDLAGAAALLDAGIGAVAGHQVAPPVHLWGLWALLRTVVGDSRKDNSGAGRTVNSRDALRASPAVLRAVNRGALGYADAVVAGRAGDAARAADLFAARGTVARRRALVAAAAADRRAAGRGRRWLG